MAQVELRFDVKPASFVTDNPNLVLADGEPIFLEDGSYAFGDNSTTLENLTFFSPGSEGGTRKLSGGNIEVVSDDITVEAVSYFISGQGTFSAPETDFNNITLSASGNTRYIGFFGTTSGIISKVEGDEGAVATYPSTPADTCPIGYVEVTDGGVEEPETPQPVNFSDIGGNASDNASLAAYVTSGTLTLTNKRVTKRRVVVTQSATPTINTNNGDIFSITGLAQAITSFTTNLSGTPVAGDMMMIQITDDGTARAITWGASFQSTSGATLPTTTVISTMLRVLFQWNSVASKWDCIGVC